MKALIQRVTEAAVTIDGEIVGQIERGMLVLLGIEKQDDEGTVSKMASRLLGYRVFGDEAGKMNLNVGDVGGGLLVVSQFTLAADTRKGLRPGFSSAAAPDRAETLYRSMVEQLKKSDLHIATGRFGADMKVQLINDGPVTFLLDM